MRKVLIGVFLLISSLFSFVTLAQDKNQKGVTAVDLVNTGFGVKGCFIQNYRLFCSSDDGCANWAEVFVDDDVITFKCMASRTIKGMASRTIKDKK